MPATIKAPLTTQSVVSGVVVFQFAQSRQALCRSWQNGCAEERNGFVEERFGRRSYDLILKVADFFAFFTNLGEGIDADLKMDL